MQRSAQWRAASQGLEATAGVAWRAAKAAPAVEQQLRPALAALNPLGTLVGTLGRTPAAQQLTRQLIPQLARTPVAQALQGIDRRLDADDSARLAPQLGRQSAPSPARSQDKAARQQLVAAERALLAERAQYITQVANGQKNVVQRAMDGLREQFTHVTTGQRGVLDDAVKNYDASIQRIRATGQRFDAGKITAQNVRQQVQQTGQAFVSEDTRVRGVQARQLEWGMAAAGVSRDVGAIVAATGVTIGSGGNIFLGAAAGYAAKEAGDLAIEAVGSTGGQSQRQMTQGQSWVFHVATQAPRGNLGSWRDARQALVREGGDLAWSTVDALGANVISKVTTKLALRWAPQIFNGAAAANPALKLQFLARGGLASGGVYQQALPSLLIMQRLSTALASATAATTWQLRRGVGEVAATATQVAAQEQVFSARGIKTLSAEGLKTIGDKAFEQMVALPFASMSSGVGALLPNAGGLAIASQAVSDTSFGVVEGQITTRQREGRWMNDLELFTRTYGSGLGSANNLILHPNNLRHVAAEQATSRADQRLPRLEAIEPRQRGQVIAEHMREAISQHGAGTGNPSRLTAVLAWANEGASIRGADGRTSRRAWEPTDRAAYVALGAEINWLLTNHNPSAANGAVQDGATAQPGGPSALVRAANAAVEVSDAAARSSRGTTGLPQAYNSTRPFIRSAASGTDAGTAAPETNTAGPGTVGADSTAPLSAADRLLQQHDVPRSIDPLRNTERFAVASKMRMAMEPTENDVSPLTGIFGDDPIELNSRFKRHGVLFESPQSYGSRQRPTEEQVAQLLRTLEIVGRNGAVYPSDFRGPDIHPGLRLIVAEVDAVQKDLELITGVPMTDRAINLRTIAADVHIDPHHDYEMFRYFRGLGLDGTPTTHYLLDGPEKQEYGRGALVAGTYLKSAGYRAVPHGVLVPGVPLGPDSRADYRRTLASGSDSAGGKKASPWLSVQEANPWSRILVVADFTPDLKAFEQQNKATALNEVQPALTANELLAKAKARRSLSPEEEEAAKNANLRMAMEPSSSDSPRAAASSDKATPDAREPTRSELLAGLRDMKGEVLANALLANKADLLHGSREELTPQFLRALSKQLQHDGDLTGVRIDAQALLDTLALRRPLHESVPFKFDGSSKDSSLLQDRPELQRAARGYAIRWLAAGRPPDVIAHELRTLFGGDTPPFQEVLGLGRPEAAPRNSKDILRKALKSADRGPTSLTPDQEQAALTSNWYRYALARYDTHRQGNRGHEKGLIGQARHQWLEDLGHYRGERPPYDDIEGISPRWTQVQAWMLRDPNLRDHVGSFYPRYPRTKLSAGALTRISESDRWVRQPQYDRIFGSPAVDRVVVPIDHSKFLDFIEVNTFLRSIGYETTNVLWPAGLARRVSSTSIGEPKIWPIGKLLRENNVSVSHTAHRAFETRFTGQIIASRNAHDIATVATKGTTLKSCLTLSPEEVKDRAHTNLASVQHGSLALYAVSSNDPTAIRPSARQTLVTAIGASSPAHRLVMPNENGRVYGKQTLDHVLQQASMTVRGWINEEPPQPDLYRAHSAVYSPTPLFLPPAAGVLDLRGTDLATVDFHRADLTRVDFGRANLRGASFLGALMHGTNLHGADLRAARLGNGVARGNDAEGLTTSQLSEAVYDRYTVFPSYLSVEFELDLLRHDLFPHGSHPKLNDALFEVTQEYLAARSRSIGTPEERGIGPYEIRNYLLLELDEHGALIRERELSSKALIRWLLPPGSRFTTSLKEALDLLPRAADRAGIAATGARQVPSTDANIDAIDVFASTVADHIFFGKSSADLSDHLAGVSGVVLQARSRTLLENELLGPPAAGQASGPTPETSAALQAQWSRLDRDGKIDVIHRAQVELHHQLVRSRLLVKREARGDEPSWILDAVEFNLKTQPALSEWQALHQAVEEKFRNQIPVGRAGLGSLNDSIRAAVVQQALMNALTRPADDATADVAAQRFVALTPDEREALLTRVEQQLPGHLSAK
ncbi:MAG: pentapeptide repeat-containing protein [Burkholderiales bacterium]|nr:pentapeptide repeat-containing protein [Burkholderiales bacterium]